METVVLHFGQGGNFSFGYGILGLIAVEEEGIVDVEVEEFALDRDLSFALKRACFLFSSISEVC